MALIHKISSCLRKILDLFGVELVYLIRRLVCARLARRELGFTGDPILWDPASHTFGARRCRKELAGGCFSAKKSHCAQVEKSMV